MSGPANHTCPPMRQNQNAHWPHETNATLSQVPRTAMRKGDGCRGGVLSSACFRVASVSLSMWVEMLSQCLTHSSAQHAELLTYPLSLSSCQCRCAGGVGQKSPGTGSEARHRKNPRKAAEDAAMLGQAQRFTHDLAISSATGADSERLRSGCPEVRVAQGVDGLHPSARKLTSFPRRLLVFPDTRPLTSERPP